MSKINIKERIARNFLVVEGDFLVVKSEAAEARNGRYANLSVTDGESTVNARRWQYDGELPTVGMVIKILGTIEFYKDTPQINIKRWFEGETEAIEFARDLPAGKAPDIVFSLLTEAATITDGCLSDLVEYLINTNKYLAEKVPAAITNHHNYMGGWAQHTYEVYTLAVSIAKAQLETSDLAINVDLVKAGALLHDIGKLYGYTMVGMAPEMTQDGKFFEHIMLGGMMIQDASRDVTVEPSTLQKLIHIVASHHGELEWGSPVKPCIPEALIVHHADNLSAKLEMMNEVIKQTPGDWSNKNYALGARIYTK